MVQPCECYKKLKYLEQICNLSNDDLEELEGEDFYEQQLLEPPEKAVTLPGAIYINERVTEYPDVQNTDMPVLFQSMSEIISGVNDFSHNIFSFWVIDIFLECLLTAQVAGMDHSHQKAMLHWIAYFYNMVQGTSKKTNRTSIFRKLKFLLLASDDIDLEGMAAENESEENQGSRKKEFSTASNKNWELPFPPIWNDSKINHFQNETGRCSWFFGQVNFTVTGSTSSKMSGRSENQISMASITKQQSSSVEPATSEQDLEHMEIIVEVLYRIFGRLWSFVLLQTSLHSTPTVEIVDLPFQLNIPKQLLKVDSVTQLKGDRGGKKTSFSKTSEFGADKESIKNDFILPLQNAEGTETLLRNLFTITSQESMNEKEKLKTERKKK